MSILYLKVSIVVLFLSHQFFPYVVVPVSVDRELKRKVKDVLLELFPSPLWNAGSML